MKTEPTTVKLLSMHQIIIDCDNQLDGLRKLTEHLKTLDSFCLGSITYDWETPGEMIILAMVEIF